MSARNRKSAGTRFRSPQGSLRQFRSYLGRCSRESSPPPKIRGKKAYILILGIDIILDHLHQLVGQTRDAKVMTALQRYKGFGDLIAVLARVYLVLILHGKNCNQIWYFN